jgi:nucleoside-diphosphate-sugar epimerase
MPPALPHRGPPQRRGAEPVSSQAPLGGRTIVTGCAGFIGSHLCDRLLADGNVVVGIDSFEDYYPRAQKEANIAAARSNPRFTLIEANVLDLAAEGRAEGGVPLAELLDGAARVYHLAAQAGVRASWGASFEIYTRNNVLATQQMLEACVAAGVPKVIYASSSSVYGDAQVLPLVETARPEPRSPYGVTKLAAEHLCGLYHANHGLDTVALRFFTVYGPRQRPDMAFHKFIRALLDGREIVIYGDGTQTRDFTFIDDIVDGLARAHLAPAGSVMNLGGGNRVSLADAIATLGRVAGVEPKLTLQGVEAGDVRDTWADISRAVSLIGYEPTTRLDDGLAREVKWLTEKVVAADPGR